MARNKGGISVTPPRNLKMKVGREKESSLTDVSRRGTPRSAVTIMAEPEASSEGVVWESLAWVERSS